VKKLDFTSCNQLAYSEVRANRESECKIGKFNYLSNLCRGSRDRLAASAEAVALAPSDATATAPSAATSLPASYISSLSAKFSNGYNNWCTDRLKDCTRQGKNRTGHQFVPLLLHPSQPLLRFYSPVCRSCLLCHLEYVPS
jgi:hypothetical protein